MSSLVEVVLPHEVGRVELMGEEEAESLGGYEAGFASGYQAGLWKARLERDIEAEVNRTAVSELLGSLNLAHEELRKLAQQHLPQLVLAAASRVFKGHRFSDEELSSEISELLTEVAQASSVKVELSTGQLAQIRERVEGMGVTLTQGHVEWKENASLIEGEFLFRSDLGEVDGRKSMKVAQVRRALEGLGG